ncbi:MAG: sialate O-acetylesterase [Planctomycetes bacterium]|nr:sialate O-acetylesterase [Planctomycetota bacterium]
MASRPTLPFSPKAFAGGLAVLLLSGAAQATPPTPIQQVALQAFPKDGQLYVRGSDDLATVEVRGVVVESGWDQIVLRVATRNATVDEQSLPLSYTSAGATFSTSTQLRAGLRDYKFTLNLRNNSEEQQVAIAQSVVAGDAFLIAGQSNAVALDYWDENLANLSQKWWIRSFGTQAVGATESRNNLNWYIAEGETQRKRGSVGSWGLLLGEQMVERLGMPVAIINGAVGGTPIFAHQRNDANPTDTSTIYGRLLWRADQSGLREKVRAIFWYQGESDGPNAVFYGRRFDSLIADWREDYPRLEKVYAMQVRQGCAVDADTNIFEAQRELPLRHPEVTLMSTSALPLHDGCHYLFGGYEELSLQLARVVARDFYRRGFGPEVEPPDAIAAWRANAAGDQVVVEFDDSAVGLTAKPKATLEFVLDDGAIVTQVTAQGSQLLLQLDRPTAATSLRFIGRAGGKHSRVTNGLGLGALLFNLPLN